MHHTWYVENFFNQFILYFIFTTVTYSRSNYMYKIPELYIITVGTTRIL